MQTLLASDGKQSKALDADLADLSGLTRIRRDCGKEIRFGFLNYITADGFVNGANPRAFD